MNLTRVLSIVLFLVSLGLAYYLYDTINSSIKFREYVADTEAQIKDKLEIIREAEKAYLEQHGRYTANWDSLINFIKNGQVPITVRTEKITPLSYGQEKVEIIIDTIGYTSAFDRIFKKNISLNATTDGVFAGFLVKPGDYVVKGRNAYRLRIHDNPRPDVFRFTEEGTITSLANIKPGDRITRGTNLINMWYYQLNPNVDLNTLHIVPGSGKPFAIYVGKVERNNLKVNVIEVKDPAPINPDRRETNEAINRQPLKFGSKTDVALSGNWE